MSLGEKLKGLRVKSKKTLRQQGTLLGVSMNSVYRWEHNLTIPRKPVLNKIANLYSVSFEWLTSEESSASLVSEMELDLLGMYRKLSDQSRYKVLGYVERMSVEDIYLEEYL